MSTELVVAEGFKSSSPPVLLGKHEMKNEILRQLEIAAENSDIATIEEEHEEAMYGHEESSEAGAVQCERPVEDYEDDGLCGTTEQGVQIDHRFAEKFAFDGTPYKEIEQIGRGAYGSVCKALDTAENRHVAVKKIQRAFTAVTLVKRTLREVRILRDLAHENIVPLLDIFATQGVRGRDIYLVLDLMETDLHEIIHSEQSLCDQHHKYFLYQILRGLKYLHSVGIVHRDLKPSNIFVNSDCLLKIGDFGMSRSVDNLQVHGNCMTQYVSTRWYRAPELLFEITDYDTKVDIWSAGCILGEMISRHQLFPGRDRKCQVKLLVHYLGAPPRALYDMIAAENVRRWVDDCGQPEPIPLERILDPSAKHPPTSEAIDILKKLLEICPWDRSTAEVALTHSFFGAYHNPGTEPVAPETVSIDAEAIERLGAEQLVEALEQEAEFFETLRGPYFTGPIEDVNDEIRVCGCEVVASTSSGPTKCRQHSSGAEITSEAAPSRSPEPMEGADQAEEADESADGCATPTAVSSGSSTASCDTVCVVDWSRQNSAGPSNAAPADRDPMALGRQIFKRVLERKLEDHEKLLRNALKLAYSQQNKRKKKDDDGRDGLEATRTNGCHAQDDDDDAHIQPDQ